MASSPVRRTAALALPALLGFLVVPLAHGQAIRRVSIDSNGGEGNGQSGSYFPALSADGRQVLFDSDASNLVAGDSNGVDDVFAHDVSTGATVRLSVDSSGAEGDSDSFNVGCSADGRFVVFGSGATNLVAGDTNAAFDIFVRDRDPDGNGIFDEANGVTTRVSLDSQGNEGNGHSFWPAISADGRYVAFESLASNLVAGDTNGLDDVFLHDRVTGETRRVSLDSSGREGNGDSFFASISADGSHVGFASAATNLVHFDTNGADDAFVHDVAAGQTTRVSVDSNGDEAALGGEGPLSFSQDGAVVGFWSYSGDLVANDTNGVGDVFVHDRSTGATTRVSVASDGGEGDNASYWPALTGDGTQVLFTSVASNLAVKANNGIFDVFLHDRASGKTTLLSSACPGPTGNANSGLLAITPDGRHVAFCSESTDLVANDNNLEVDTFLVDRDAELAAWSNYGAGYAGTHGVPNLTARADPVLGTSLTLDVENSSGAPAAATLLLGLHRASIPTGKGGTLLVDAFLFLPVALPAVDLPLGGSLPDDPTLVGAIVDLQAVEADPGAAYRLSFTPGLELTLGY
jgi:Tol biopolymer transport system component